MKRKSTDEPACPECGLPWSQHYSVTRICHERKELLAKVKKQQAELKEIRAYFDKLAKLVAMIALAETPKR